MLAGRVSGTDCRDRDGHDASDADIVLSQAIDRVMSLERERPPERTYVARQVAQGRVAFEKVTFRYPKAAENALEKVSFKIAAGERVGIIGRVGSGKTTVGRLLRCFL